MPGAVREECELLHIAGFFFEPSPVTKENKAMFDAAATVAKIYVHMQEAQLRANQNTQEDWTAYMKALEREERVLGMAAKCGG